MYLVSQRFRVRPNVTAGTRMDVAYLYVQDIANTAGSILVTASTGYAFDHRDGRHATAQLPVVSNKTIGLFGHLTTTSGDATGVLLNEGMLTGTSSEYNVRVVAVSDDDRSHESTQVVTSGLSCMSSQAGNVFALSACTIRTAQHTASTSIASRAVRGDPAVAA